MRILRFDITARILHWSHTLVFIWLLITGIVLFITPRSLLDDPLIKMVHMYASLPLILFPGIIYLYGSISTRNDIKELMEWTQDDLDWFPGFFKKNKIPATGKFNAGQKANFLFVLILITGLFLTGFVVWMKSMFSQSFVELNFLIHDSLAIFSILLLAGHIMFALYYSESLKSIIYGTIDVAWAKEHYPGWFKINKKRELFPLNS
ncbi:MAG TPA: cytochrome b/b6 domain-containing protein [Candidatus Methylomirabilis sp.]|nr:cytochrome b/b6 domain-containing protein [Candidatus Methylomirabilis sp.]